MPEVTSNASVSTLSEKPSTWKPLRIWPPAFLLAGMVFFRFLPGLWENGPPQLWMSAAFGPALCSLAILGWWLLASRARWSERIVGLLCIVTAVITTVMLVDVSMRGPAVIILTVPMGVAGFAVGTMLCARWFSWKRTFAAVMLAVIGFSFSTLLRTDGMWGNFALGLSWRWTPSSEEKLQNAAEDSRVATISDQEIRNSLINPQWPGFRGPDRNGIEHGPVLAADWNAHPPEQLWKIVVGPGWSSFAVAGNLLFTQEQRGENEAVVCYAADSGREVWKYEVQSRFDDPLGGPGPRATPTLADGRLFALGASGHLTRLAPETGEKIWQQDLRTVADRTPPMWGFSSSPLVVGSVVIVYAGGDKDKGVLAFELETGALKWSAATGHDSYSSPQLATIAGEQSVLMLTNEGLTAVDPVTGAERLNYAWHFEGYRAAQPQLLADDRILLPTTATGTRCLHLLKNADQLTAEELWTSRNLKTDFSDCVIDQGNAYGFDGAIFASINLDSGDRNWKGGRYGKGQVLLLKESGLLLVAGEQGELVLLRVNPKESTELARFQALSGKTWNHPVVIGDRLFIRNSQEAACFKLPLADKVAITMAR